MQAVIMAEVWNNVTRLIPQQDSTYQVIYHATCEKLGVLCTSFFVTWTDMQVFIDPAARTIL